MISWSESNQRNSDILLEEAMEPQYHQFGSADNSSAYGERKIMPQLGMKGTVAFVLYSILVLLLLILLMVTGIKFSQLNKEITDVKIHLERIGHEETLWSNSEAITAQKDEFQKIVPVRGTCGEGWISFERSCYFLSTTVVTWSKAEEQCRTYGGHLVVLNNEEELDYLSKVVELRHSYWIGLVEREHEGHWSWVDGTDLNSTATFWDNGQPDDWDYRENGEDCGQLHASQRRHRKMWNDADCNLHYHYICETKL